MKKGVFDLIRLTAAAALILLIFLFMLPLFGQRVLHIGMIYPSAVFLLLVLALIFPDAAVSLFHGRFKVASWIFTVGLCVFALGCAAVICAMWSAASKTPPEDATVVVLGCQVRGEQPSRMLTDRMNSALEYLNENPDSKCIASGGKGSGEDISEAEAIFRYLTAHGIAADRIYLEDRSVNTSQNLAYSAEIIKNRRLSDKVAIASDNFHQLRAEMFAKRCGLDAYSLGCATYKKVAAGYWAREILAVYKALIFGR